ncbi:MAG: DUF4249 family protein [Bacteroidota bacterium]
MRAYFFFILLAIILSSSCEDVIDVDLPTAESKLVVNGIIRVDTTQEFVPVEIRFSESSNFFDDNTPTQVDQVFIIYGQPDPRQPELLLNVAFSNLAEEVPGTGIYTPDPNFSMDQRIRTSAVFPGTLFILQVSFKDRSYASRTFYAPAVAIDNLEQGDNTLFDEDDTEVLVTITDPPDEQNYYVFDFGFGEFLALDDQFIDGQDFEFSYFYERDLEPGDVVDVSVLGADREFHNYINLLVEQTENDGGVFETPAATIRGNVFDVTGLDNNLLFDNVNRPETFPLGYFAVVEEFTQTLTIE